MIRKLLKKLTPPRRADFGIKWSDDWKRIHHGTLYRLDKETGEGVRIRVSNDEVYKHMETGKIQIIERKDSKTEWFDHDDRVDWPDYARRAVEDGYTWHDPDRDGLPFLWGAIISNSPRSLWKRVDDVEPPRSAQ